MQFNYRLMHIWSALKHLISFKMVKCHFFGGQSRDESFQNVNCFYMTKTTDISIKKSCYIVKIIYVFPNFAKCSLNAYRQYYIVKND